MNAGKTLFAQVMEFVTWTSFKSIVQRHGGDFGARALSCAEQFHADGQLALFMISIDVRRRLSRNLNEKDCLGLDEILRRYEWFCLIHLPCIVLFRVQAQLSHVQCCALQRRLVCVVYCSLRRCCAYLLLTTRQIVY